MDLKELNELHRQQLVDQLSVLEFILSDLNERKQQIKGLLKLKSNEYVELSCSDQKRLHMVEMIEQCLVNLTYKCPGLGKITTITKSN